MSTRLVCDASALVAVLLDTGPEGRWATDRLAGADLAAPDLMPFEAANVIRRLLDLSVERWPYDLLAARSRELRRNLTAYDAAHVALAELLGSSLVTLGLRIAGTPGLRCDVATPA